MHWADGVARANGLVGCLCREPRLLLIDLDEGVQLRIEARDAIEACVDDVDWRDAARLEPGGQRVDGKLGETCAHGRLPFKPSGLGLTPGCLAADTEHV